MAAYTLAHVMPRGVAVNADTLGGDTASGTKQVHVYVNGEPASPDLSSDDGDDVVVAHGTLASFPKIPPADAFKGA